MLRVILYTALLSALLLVFSAAAASAKPSPGTKTLENLQAAYNGESNAHVRYLEFADKADRDGYKGVASLFRAAAHAEQVHSERFSEVIKKMGAEPVAVIVAVKVGTTKENLEAAVKGETEERDKIYAAGIKQAEADNDSAAVIAFEFAKSAEDEHAKLYTAALRNMEEWKEVRAFNVCPTCGKTVEKVDFEYCPVCATPGSKFDKVR